MEAGGVLGFGCSEKFKNAVAWHARAVLAMRVPPLRQSRSHLQRVQRFFRQPAPKKAN